MISAIIIAILVIAALAYVSAPLRREPSLEEDPTPSPADTADEKKRAALAGIVDIEQELEAGKLDPQDFETLKEDYERDALEALKELDAMRERDAMDDVLEHEIAAARERLRCPTCGGARSPEGPCSRCGA